MAENVVRGANTIEEGYGDKNYLCDVCHKKKARWVMHYYGNETLVDDVSHLCVCSNECGLVLARKSYVACGCGG